MKYMQGLAFHNSSEMFAVISHQCQGWKLVNSPGNLNLLSQSVK